MSFPLLADTPLTASFAAKVWFATVHRLGVVFAALGFNMIQHRLLTEEACTTAAPAMMRSSPLRQLTRVFRFQADLFRRGMEAIPHRIELSQPKTQFFFSETATLRPRTCRPAARHLCFVTEHCRFAPKQNCSPSNRSVPS